LSCFFFLKVKKYAFSYLDRCCRLDFTCSAS
jgi:hypothetical protein